MMLVSLGNSQDMNQHKVIDEAGTFDAGQVVKYDSGQEHSGG